VAGFAAAIFGGLIVTIVVAAVGGDLDDSLPPGALMAATFVQDVALVGAAILFARLSGPVVAEHFGLRRPRLLQSIGWIVVVYVLFLTLSAIWSEIVELPQEQEVLDQLGVRQSDVALAFGAVLVVLLAPLVEEFFFRGFFFRALRNWRGFWPAALATGTVFGLIHWETSAVGVIVPLAVLGFGLCLLYERTGSLYPCIAVHAVNNSIAFGVSVGWDWQIPILTAGSLAACAAVIAVAKRLWGAERLAAAGAAA
jgi:membrane protease YdiL (CAAX protease family)